MKNRNREFFKDNGYFVSKKIFEKSEIEEAVKEGKKILNNFKKRKKEIEGNWPGNWGNEEDKNKSLLSCHNLQQHSSVFSKMIFNEKFLKIARSLIGENIRLHHTKYHIKPQSSGARLPLHQDYHYFPFKNNSMVAALIHLNDTSVENGCVCVMPKSNLKGPLEHIHDKSFYLDPSKYKIEDCVPIEAEAGSVLFVNYLTIHGSYENKSENDRPIFLVQMHEATDVRLKEIHISPDNGLLLTGAGLAPGMEPFVDLSKTYS